MDDLAGSPELARLSAEVAKYADRLVAFGQLPWFGGNNSVRIGDRLLITRTSTVRGAREGRSQTVLTGIFEDDEQTPWASTALPIHRAIYKATDAQAVIHAHPYHATLLSFFVDAIEPIDENGRIYLGDRVDVVAAPQRNGWNLVADELAAALGRAPVVVLKWHGTFAIGASLSEALHAARAIEDAARFIVDVPKLKRSFGAPRHLPTEAAGILGGEGTRTPPPAGVRPPGP